MNKPVKAAILRGHLSVLMELVVTPFSPYLQPSSHFPYAAMGEDDTMPLPWDILQGLIQGESIIDQQVLHVQTREDAYKLALAYGFDLSQPSDARYLSHLLGESLHFISDRLLEPGLGDQQFAALNLVLPPELYERDVPQLCLMASDKSLQDLSHWACAILKVLHTLIHIEYTPRLRWLERAHEQFVSGYAHILRYREGQPGVMLGQPGGAKQLLLYGVEMKDQKTRDSLLLKLLSRKNNVVELIDDLMGVRLITHNVPDVLVALDILMDAQLLIFSNIKAERSRNTLIDLEEFQALWKHGHTRANHSGISTKGALSRKKTAWEDLLSTLTKLDASLPTHSFLKHNPHSDDNYRALHITTRQVIHIPATETEPAQRAFFPYEIQLIDKAHYISNQEGDVAHSRYKHRQLQRGRRRILGPLLPHHLRETPETEEGDLRLKQPFEARDSMEKRNLIVGHDPLV
jgi:uncharacterized protein (TIGR04562 family)